MDVSLITNPRLRDAFLVRQRIFDEPVTASGFGFADADPLYVPGGFPLVDGIHQLPFSCSGRAVRIKQVGAVM